jgi:hypothetical protein
MSSTISMSLSVGWLAGDFSGDEFCSKDSSNTSKSSGGKCLGDCDLVTLGNDCGSEEANTDFHYY